MTEKPSDVLLVNDDFVTGPGLGGEAKFVLPLHDEELAVSRRRVATGVVQVAVATNSREAVVDEALTHERVEIERIPIGRIVDTVPPVRDEGNVTIIPVIEEIVVVEKRLLLKEEVHVRKVRVTERYQDTVILRQQEAVVTRKNTDTKPTN